MLICAFTYSESECLDKSGSAVGIDRVVAGMVGKHHCFEPAAFGESGGNGKHYAIAKRHHGRLHVFVGVMTFGYGVGAA